MQTPPTAKSAVRQNPAVTELLVHGMTCPNCARHVTEAIQSVPGVRSASVTLASGSATARWDANAPANVPAVLSAIAAAGYKARPVETAARDHGEHRRSRWQWNLLLGVGVTVTLMLGEWGFDLGMKPWFQWFSFVLAGVVQIFAGAQFYRGAWNQLKIGSSNMDTLVALGSTTAFGYSAWALLAGVGGHVYFMEAAAIITLITTGHWLEARVSDKASSALKSLLNLAPQTARRIDSGRADLPVGQDAQQRVPAELEVPVAELQTGDLVALRPGDRVPVDGTVMEGDSAIDESMLTGESVPVDKKIGSELFAGTVNLNGRLVLRVTVTGEATALAHIIAAVQRAQTSRAHIQRLGDRVSSVFVPAVVAIAIAAGLWWGLAPESAGKIHDALAPFFWPARPPVGTAAGFIIAAAILIVACPCAMGLATPAAIMAGANTAARRGILIRDGVALEKAGKITVVVFDKTGTITEGRPEVAAVEKCGVRSAEFGVEKLAATLARDSTHPVSQAIAKSVSEGGVPRRPNSNEYIRDSQSSPLRDVAGWKEIRGCGVEAKIQPSTLNPVSRRSEVEMDQLSTFRLGSLRWLKESGVVLAAGETFIAEWSGQGATIVGLAFDKTLLGLFAVRDTVKPNAAKVIAQLQQHGLETFMVTGDNSLTARSIAKQVGIATANVFAEVRPEQKAEFVKKLQAGGGTGVPPVRSAAEIHGRDARATCVAFVGDGINDAPALTQADLGIAVSRASDIAREAADIILLKSEIEAVPEALGLARATLRTIKQNLFWAFFYNALGVPLAALGFISPIFCAAAMGASDLIVIGNALRLLRWR